MAVQTSIVVEFGDSTPTDDDVVIIELDENESSNLDSDGEVKSVFLPTESPIIMIHHASTVQINAVKTTNGVLTALSGNVQRVRESDFLITEQTTTETLNYAGINSFRTTKFYGNQCGLSVANSVVSTNGGVYPCKVDVSFNVLFQHRYRLTPPYLSLSGDETYPIVIVVYASVRSQ